MPVQKRRIYLFFWMTMLALLFLMIALSYQEPFLVNFDEWIQSYLYDFLGSFGDFIFIVITYIGSAFVSFPVTGIIICFFLIQKRYWTALLFCLQFVGVRQLNWLLKSIFERPRPELEHLVVVSSDSFPSGHSMNAIAFFGFIAYLLHLVLKAHRKKVRLVWICAALLIGLIGISRVYLGVHYPSDVVGGFLAGGAWLLFSIFIYTFIPEKERLN